MGPHESVLGKFGVRWLVLGAPVLWCCHRYTPRASCNLPLQVLILLAQRLRPGEPAATWYDLILNYKEKHFEVTSNLTALAYMKSQSIIII